MLGPIEYGQASREIQVDASTKYQAFAFNGKGGDQIEVTIQAKQGEVKAYLTNARFESMAGGDAHFSASIPVGSKPSTYYIITTAGGKPARFKVELERPSVKTAEAAPQYLTCTVDSECVAVPREGCCHNGYKDAVNRNEVDAYRAANACKDRHVICPQFIINDTRVAVCNKAKGRCEMTQAKAIE
jgi:hypothetical protein